MPRRGLPGVLEDGRNFPGSHGAAIEENRKQDPPPRGMRQRSKYQFISINPRLLVSLRHATILSHVA